MTMKITVLFTEALRQDTPLLALGVWQGEALPAPIAALAEEGDWSGDLKHPLLLYPRGALPARRVLLIGLGRRGEISAGRLREAAAIAAQHARDLKLANYSFELPTSEGVALADG